MKKKLTIALGLVLAVVTLVVGCAQRLGHAIHSNCPVNR